MQVEEQSPEVLVEVVVRLLGVLEVEVVRLLGVLVVEVVLLPEVQALVEVVEQSPEVLELEEAEAEKPVVMVQVMG